MFDSSQKETPGTNGSETNIIQVKVPADKVLMPGVLDTTTTHVEHHRLVTQRLQASVGARGRKDGESWT